MKRRFFERGKGTVGLLLKNIPDYCLYCHEVDCLNKWALSICLDFVLQGMMRRHMMKVIIGSENISKTVRSTYFKFIFLLIPILVVMALCNHVANLFSIQPKTNLFSIGSSVQMLILLIQGIIVCKSMCCWDKCFTFSTMR